MQLNSDFSQRVAVHAALQAWVASPMPGVERRMLDRVGDEVARATSIVRYAPGSHFSPHVHHGGEEFLVLDGVFQDEHGDYPAGSYLRNPPGSSHTPGSLGGCTIFVKLWQFDPGDCTSVRLRTAGRGYLPDPACAGVERLSLHDDERECVRLERWSPGAVLRRAFPGGAEVLCLEGEFLENGERFSPSSWLRLPCGAALDATAGAAGALVWIKSGHLMDLEAQIARLHQSG